MTTRAPHTALAADWKAANEWWTEAGVDCVFRDEPQQWLAEADEKGKAPEAPHMASQPAAPPAPEETRIGGDPASWPGDVAGFTRWWLTEPSLAPGDPRLRVPPRLIEGSWLLVLVPEPEAADADRLLSGEQGELLSSFLDKAGVEETQVQIASALPRHMGSLADWRRLKEEGLGYILAHLVALAAPERVLALGRPVIDLLGDAVSEDWQLSTGGRTIPLLSGRSLDVLVKRPKQRVGLWTSWHKWMGKELP